METKLRRLGTAADTIKHRRTTLKLKKVAFIRPLKLSVNENGEFLDGVVVVELPIKV